MPQPFSMGQQLSKKSLTPRAGLHPAAGESSPALPRNMVVSQASSYQDQRSRPASWLRPVAAGESRPVASAAARAKSIQLEKISIELPKYRKSILVARLKLPKLRQ